MYSKFDPEPTKELTNRAVKILDANYEKSDLPKIFKDTCSHFKQSKKLQLLSLLQQYEQMIDGNHGDWKTKSVNFELKEGAKPYHGRPFPVPQIHRRTLQKEVDRMV